MRRPSWDETWLAVANDVAQRSGCVRAKVGAVIVDPTNRIVATGYNGPPAGYGPQCFAGGCERPNSFAPSPCYDDCIAIHAEANALMFCDRRDREGGTLYVSEAVCFTCAKLVANSGLERVVVGSVPNVGHRDPHRSIRFLRDCGLEVVSWQD